MAGHGKVPGIGSGPGNKMIATAVLEWLAIRGRPSARARAARALEQGMIGIGTAPAWLSGDTVAAVFAAGEVDAALARAIGHRLVTPDVTGLRLYGLGLATPEKAYRRIEGLLPREAADAHWFVEEIAGGSARLRFEANPNADPSAPVRGRSEAALCGLRTGMLEAIPGLYGLLPAKVHETSCRAKGADACRYEVTWGANSRAGALAGLAVGGGVAAGLVTASVWFGGVPLLAAGSRGSTWAVAISALVVGTAIGRARDLMLQLEAVAGARRGHLALFDQVDDALATKLDVLARADAKLEGASTISPVRRPRSVFDPSEGNVSSEDQRAIVAAAQQIHAAAGDLECWFEADRTEESRVSRSPISDERGLVREIRDWAARIGRLGSTDAEEPRSRVDLTTLVARAIATARPSLAPAAIIVVDAARDLYPIECEPISIERVVMQLVRNAVEASVELSAAPEIVITLSNGSQGVTLAVEDRGVGIESAKIDELFDPFFGDRPTDADGGLGLNDCLEIIERHGGELRIENENRAGTRVSVWLPESGKEDAR